ncbi:hypothetical protein SD81_033815 [Tolypothrix campylonemoides VB511288]|nr:hypothetical protein SD81_033815 [Tolypothrix campylonemoides VB511288]
MMIPSCVHDLHPSGMPAARQGRTPVAVRAGNPFGYACGTPRANASRLRRETLLQQVVVTSPQ